MFLEKLYTPRLIMMIWGKAHKYKNKEKDIWSYMRIR